MPLQQDYIQDLHQATRFSVVQSEVDALYGSKFQVIWVQYIFLRAPACARGSSQVLLCCLALFPSPPANLPCTTPPFHHTHTYQELHKAYYGDKTPWPSVAAIGSLCMSGKSPDAFFLCFYKEMTDRHLAASSHRPPQDIIDSWANYCALFDFVIAVKDVGITISEQWAFDVVHEFVYGFQSFCQFRSDLSRRDGRDLEVLAANPGAWNVATVASYLKRLVAVGNVAGVLAAAKAAGVASGDLDFHKGKLPAGAATPSKLHFDLGYFALVGLSRLECLLGDYTASLAALAPIDFGRNEYHQKVFSCYLHLYYHAGVSFLMLRRSKDAIRTFADVVTHVSRLAKSGALYAAAGSESQQSIKLAEKAASLLACALALCPGAPGKDAASGMGKDAARFFFEKLQLLETATDGGEFEQVFEKACPKFVSGAFPALDGEPSDHSREPVRRQVDLFGKMAQQQLGLAKIRSFLKLYTSIEVGKLAKFTEAKPDEIRSELLAAKRLMTQREVVEPSAGLAGDVRSALDVNFFVAASGLIQIDDGGDDAAAGGAVAAPRHEGFFMAEIMRAESMARQVLRRNLTRAHRRRRRRRLRSNAWSCRWFFCSVSSRARATCAEECPCVWFCGLQVCCCFCGCSKALTDSDTPLSVLCLCHSGPRGGEAPRRGEDGGARGPEDP